MLKHMYKYRLRGIYNDLSKYLINMLKFYGQGIALILGVLVTLVLFLETIITTIDINVYFNYIFSIAIVVGILGYMYSPLTLIIFSNPDIFYLIRSQSNGARNCFFYLKQYRFYKLYKYFSIIINYSNYS